MPSLYMFVMNFVDTALLGNVSRWYARKNLPPLLVTVVTVDPPFNVVLHVSVVYNGVRTCIG